MKFGNIYIHLGPPRTASSLLQENFFPNIEKINFIGKKDPRKEDYLSNLIKEYFFDEKKNESKIIEFFNKLDKNQILLFSDDNILLPFYSDKKNEILFQDVTQNILILENLLYRVGYKTHYFVIKRDPITALKSFYFKFTYYLTNYDFSLNNINNLIYKKNDPNIKKILNIYDYSKLEEFFNKKMNKKIEMFQYENLLNNKKKFVNDIENFFKINIENKDFLIKKLEERNNESQKVDSGYLYKTSFIKKIKLFYLINKIIPITFKKAISKILSIFSINIFSHKTEDKVTDKLIFDYYYKRKKN
tara:strand:+ start:46 stop:954 length:909 start_codon:yes stop_codon:yes gene_type:complete